MWEKLKAWKARIIRGLSNEIGIDLGTANTLVYVRGQGIVINEPTIIAINKKTDQIVAIGKEAQKMFGRTPSHITVVRPLVDGVISDFEVAEEMLAYFINKAQSGNKKLLGPRVVIGVPSGITNVEQRAVRDAAKSAGARDIRIVEEPMAAALGTRLPVEDALGNMIIDSGGGTTDIAIISLSGIVCARSVNIAGDRLNQDIISYIRDTFQVLIGERTAEEIKLEAASILTQNEVTEVTVRGRDLVTGLPREIVVTDTDVREALMPSLDALLKEIKEVLETAPPEVVSDVMQRGIHLVGGGALLKGFNKLLEEWFKIPVHIADDPMTAVARGAGIVVENIEEFSGVIIEDDDELPPQ